MAIVEDVASVTVSPRISFSHDLSQSDLSPAGIDIGRMDASLPLNASVEFNFSITTGATSFDSSLADDLFSDGMLLPLPIKEKTSSASPMPAAAAGASGAPPKERAPRPPDPTLPSATKRGSLRDVMAMAEDEDVVDGPGKRSPARQKPSSFWRFGRSSSLNYSGKRAGGLCPFLLMRSKSTGSAPAPNPTRSRRPCNVHSISNTTTSTTTTGVANSWWSSTLPPSLRKAPSEPSARRYYYSGSSARSYGNAVRIGPILNVPVPAFGSLNVFSYLLCSCGDKSTRRGSAIA